MLLGQLGFLRCSYKYYPNSSNTKPRAWRRRFVPGVITRFYVFANAPFGMTLFALQAFLALYCFVIVARMALGVRRQSHRQRDGKRGEIQYLQSEIPNVRSETSSTPVRGSTAYTLEKRRRQTRLGRILRRRQGGSRRPPRRPASELRVVPHRRSKMVSRVSVAYLRPRARSRSRSRARRRAARRRALARTPRPPATTTRSTHHPTLLILRVMRPGVARSTSRVILVPVGAFELEIPPRRASHGDHRVIGRASQRAPARARATTPRAMSARRRRRERPYEAASCRAHGPPARMDRGHRGRAMALALDASRSRSRAVSVVPSTSGRLPTCGDEGRDTGGTAPASDPATRRRRSKGGARASGPSRRAQTYKSRASLTDRHRAMMKTWEDLNPGGRRAFTTTSRAATVRTFPDYHAAYAV